ncbi:MAG: T9SS type A sorting domain-containing protein, partial [Bacteroidia bacterium]|nr:T9SS type A sorting domain-containing protein [Bacteroidia bacterium]
NCRHDTLYYLHLGRTMVMDNIYDVVTGWDTAYFYPERMVWSDRQDYMMDYPIHPIVRVELDPNASVGKPILGNDISAFSAPYPNPATDCIHLGVELIAEGRVTLTFYDTKGQVLKEVERTLPAGMSQVAVDVADLPAGTYVLMARSSIGGGASFWINIVK